MSSTYYVLGQPPAEITADIPPGNVTDLVVVSASCDVVTRKATVVFTYTSPGGTFASMDVYVEVPDQSAKAAMVLGRTALGTAVPSGPWSPLFVATVQDSSTPITISFQVPDGVVLQQQGGPLPGRGRDINCRLDVVSKSTTITNDFVQFGFSDSSPSTTFILSSGPLTTPGRPVITPGGSAANVASITDDNGNLIQLLVQVLPQQTVTGVSQTPVLVQVSSVPSDPGWAYRLLMTLEGQDPTVAGNWQYVTGIRTDAGVVPADKADSIAITHTFALADTVFLQDAILWLQAGVQDNAGGWSYNNIVPGSTPSCIFEFGSSVGVLDAAASMLSTLAARMSVSSGLLDIATGGVTNPFIGSGAVHTINIQALNVTNPLLAALAVQASNMAASSVTASNNALASLAVGTAAVQLLAVTNALMANLAVGTAQIQLLAVQTAQLGLLAVADANVGSMNVSKLLSGTITTAAISISNLGGSGVVTDITQGFDSTTGIYWGLKIQDTASNTRILFDNNQLHFVDAFGNTQILLSMQSRHGTSPFPIIQVGVTGDKIAQLTSGLLVITNSAAHSGIIVVEAGSDGSGNGFVAVAAAGGSTFKVLGPQQTGPGNPSFSVVADAQTWCSNLLTALRAHGMVT